MFKVVNRPMPISVATGSRGTRVVIRDQSFKGRFREDYRFLHFLFGLFVANMLMVVPRGAQPRTTTPFVFHDLTVVPIMLTVRSVAERRHVIGLASLSARSIRDAVRLAVAVVRFLVGGRLLF